MSDLLYWLVICCLVILVVSLTNILGLTATKETNRPKNYYKVMWLFFVITIVNLVITMKDRDIGLELTPISLFFATFTLYLTRVWFIVVEDVKYILFIERLKWVKEESFKIIACLIIIFLLTSLR